MSDFGAASGGGHACRGRRGRYRWGPMLYGVLLLSAPGWAGGELGDEPAAEPAVTADNVMEYSLGVVGDARERVSDSAALDYVKGGIYEKVGRFEAALQAYQEALEARPASPEILQSIAWCFYRMNRFAEAADWYHKAIQERPHSPQAYRRLGQTLFHLGRTVEAIDALRRAVDQDAQDTVAWFYLGECLLERGRLDSAEEAAREIIRQDDRLPEPYYLLAKVARREGDRPQASKWLETFRQKKEEETERIDAVPRVTDEASAIAVAVQAHLEVGDIFRAQGRPQPAMDQYRQALALDGDHEGAALRLVEQYQNQGELSKAQRLAGRLADLNPENPRYQMTLGLLLAAQKRWDDALSALERAHNLAPEDVDVIRHYARALLASDRKPEKALELAREAVAREPVAAHYDLLARACYRQGRLGESLQAMKEAMKREPDNPVYRQRYQKLERVADRE